MEREIRNGVVDILCFLSSGKASVEQMFELEKLVTQAAEMAREAPAREKAIA